MFAKLTSVVVLTLAAFAAAGNTSTSSYDCNTGSVQCCGQMHAPGHYDVNAVKALVGAAISSVSGQVGFQCNPISVIGAGSGGNCAATTTCCKEYDSKNLIGVNCTPITGQV